MIRTSHKEIKGERAHRPPSPIGGVRNFEADRITQEIDEVIDKRSERTLAVERHQSIEETLERSIEGDFPSKCRWIHTTRTS